MYWLMKSEPDVFSIDHLAQRGVAGWDGVRNYQARNFMKDMKVGDKVFFYHSNALPPGIAGEAVVAKTAYPDPTQFDKKAGHYDPKAIPEKPIWFQVDLRFVRKFPRFLSLDELRGVPALSEMPLFNRSRLSVQPVSASQWKTIAALAAERD
ncbi:MAG: EVE domain-containing protein [Elusimicrobiota bacterium]